MPIKDLHAENFDDGTLAKLDIFESYLKAWLPVFIHSPHFSKVNICDFFAGSGSDTIGNNGSPLLILKIIDKFKHQIVEKKIKINIILNEYIKIKFKNLQEVVDSKIDNNDLFNKYVKVVYSQMDFQDRFAELTPQIKDDANLIFLDQNGVKHVTESVLSVLESFSRTDFMFFISSSYFNRFQFEEFFPDLHESLDKTKFTHIHRKILKYYKSKLPANSKTKLYPFSIKKKGQVYGLIFGSKHCLGVEKFLQVAWKKNSINGEANFDIDEEYKNKQLSLLSPPKASKLDQFDADLRDFVLSRKETTNEDVLSFTLENGFEPKEASDILRKMKNEKLIEHFSHPRIGCKQVYVEKQIVTFRRSR